MSNWRQIWQDPESGQVRYGWRAVIFVVMTYTLMTFLRDVLAHPLAAAGVLLDHEPYLQMAVSEMAMAIAALAVGLWAARTLEKLPAHTLGASLTGLWGRQLVSGFLLGAGAIVLFVLALAAVGLADLDLMPMTPEAWRTLGMILVVMLVAAAGYVLFFHGYFSQTLLRGMGAASALVLITVLYLLMAYDSQRLPPPTLATMALWCVMPALLYLRSRALWWSIGLAAGWNFTLLFCQLPLSNLPALTTPLRVTLQGPELLTGGGAGPESGILIALVQLLLVAGIVYTRPVLDLASAWWEWRELRARPDAPLSWDVAVNGRHYQWRLHAQDEAE